MKRNPGTIVEYVNFEDFGPAILAETGFWPVGVNYESRKELGSMMAIIKSVESNH